VILDRSLENSESFLRNHARRELSEAETVNAWRMLEMQRYGRLIYTSCGWFFDDISNIETVKIIEYAARAIQLARQVGGVDLETPFIKDLLQAAGNNPDLADGAVVYQKLVKPSITNLEKGMAHYAISSLIEEYSPRQQIFSFEFERNDYVCEKSASRTLAIGAVNVRSRITREELEGMFVVLHLGGYDFHCVVREIVPPAEYDGLTLGLFQHFREDSTRDLLQAIDNRIVGYSFALKDLFIEERRKLGRLLAKDALERSREHYRRIYEETRDVMRLLASLKIPAPESLKRATEYVLSQRLEQACVDLKAGTLAETQLTETAASVFREAESLGCKVDVSGLKEALEEIVYSRLEAYSANRDVAKTESAIHFLRLAEQLGLGLGLWRLQNLFWELLKEPSGTLNETQAIVTELGDKLGFSERLLSSKVEKR
jgi:hypothetical protein